MYETCDRCRFKATVHVVLTHGELYFCDADYGLHIEQLQRVFVRIEVRDSFPLDASPVLV